MLKLNNVNFNKFDKNHKLRTTMMKCFRWLPDEAYLKFVYKMRTGKRLNLKNPKTYNEKLNWLKLHNRHDEYTQMVDKVAVKEIVARQIGKQHIIPTLGTWEKFDDIDWESLPNSFVLKCNHDSGSAKIIRDKKSLSEKEKILLKKHFDKNTKSNPFYAGREYPYKNVEPYILAEPFFEQEDGTAIPDYKFFCFDGEPKLLVFITGRRADHREDYFDMDFNWLHIKNGHYESDVAPKKPSKFEEMKKIARRLSNGIKHVRVDLYEINGKIYFGEYTFFNAGGFVLFEPDEWEERLGSWIKL